ncbi:MAG: glutathione-dependent disulfide-bond oxidoreductase [Legionellales bacterium]|nr:glutathione-dependent disulfide-bond oxidoreductase [Legionellales bacterium]
MTQNTDYILPKIWQAENDLGGTWGAINRPTAGARFDAVLPRGNNPLQLYSLATPNGVKVGIMLEELIAAGHENARYDAYVIDISKGEQFSSDFVAINPNSKIPALIDTSVNPEITIFESGAILLYLAEKFNAFIPHDLQQRTRCLCWLFWQVGSAPYLGGGFGHFYKYAPTKIQYCIDRFTMETKRQLDVLDKQLAHNQYICGDTYTIADIAIFPWYGGIVLNDVYNAAEFLQAKSYKNLNRWAADISARKAVQAGKLVAKL